MVSNVSDVLVFMRMWVMKKRDDGGRANVGVNGAFMTRVIKFLDRDRRAIKLKRRGNLTRRYEP